MKRILAAAMLTAGSLGVFVTQGCGLGRLAGGMAQEFEYQKQLEVLAEYDNLTNRNVAVLVDVDPETLYMHPNLSMQIATGVVRELTQNGEKVQARVFSPEYTIRWQSQTPGWNAMPYSSMAEGLNEWNKRFFKDEEGVLNIERIIFIDVYEYRLNPPGNRYEWDGVCGANVRVIETGTDSIDPDFPVWEGNVVAKFPDMQGVGWESASAQNISLGVLSKFVRQVGWLFYDHLEDKYPGKRRPDPQ